MKTKAEKNTGAPIYYKSTGGNFKAPTPQSRVVEGCFAAFDIVDDAFDIIRPGAFAKSISERGPETTSNRQIKYLHQHRITELAGALTKLWEDSLHLNFKGEIEKTPLGDVIIERYANGTYREHSFGYQYVWDKCQWIEVPTTMLPKQHAEMFFEQKTIEVFECSELNMFEGSVVTFGCNPNTPFIGFKGTKDDLQKELSNELNFLLKHAPNYEYELRIRSLYQKQFSLIDSSIAADIKGTMKKVKPKAEEKKANIYSMINKGL